MMGKETISKHILELPSWYPPMGGQFTITQGVALQQRGFRVNVLANVILPWKDYGIRFDKYPWKLTKSDVQGLTVYLYYFRKMPKFVHLSVERWVKIYMELFERYILSEGKPDLIHTHSCIFAGYVAHLIKQKYGIPYVLTEHWDAFSMKSDYAKSLFDPFTIRLIEKAIYNADYIVTVSEEIIPGIQKFANPKTPVRSVSNIVDIEFYHIPKQKVQNERFRFVCTNDFKEMKGYDTLVEAVNLLKDKGLGFDVQIAGAYFETAEAKTVFAKSRYADTFSFTGDLDPIGVRNLLWSGDAFCLPSRSESQSISTLEALSTGLPVVCTDVVPAKIRIPQVALSVNIEAPQQLADAMEKMMKERDKYNSETIANHVKSIASAEVVSTQLKEIFDGILA